MIKLIVGLGNPGKEYENTRHNVGWIVLERLCGRFACSFSRKECKGLTAEIRSKDREVRLLKPLTYMNKSGESVLDCVKIHNLKPCEILVVYDDIDLPPGRIRLRLKGGSGGHRGMESVQTALRTTEFPRLRIGIGRPASKEEVVNYVLSPFGEEFEEVDRAIDKAVECLKKIVEEGEISQRILNWCNGGAE